MQAKHKAWTAAGFGLAVLAGCATDPGPRGPGGASFGEPILRPRVDALLLIGLDADRDRRLTKAEIASGASAAFTAADANADSVIGAIELRAYGEAAGGRAQAAPLFAALDRNGDGAATQEEFVRWFTDRHAALDEDADGVVGLADLFEELRAPDRPPRPEVLKGP
jgi:hypothetical protein